ncbi:hypothetical protein D7M10_18810 [Pseudomonas fluorescens]|uniref:Uncharacterized protein n=1 Tax=Pseudomonas shahriarae TaxID=2745512 RepID=A0ABT5NGJ0_9PSED|nr:MULTISPECIES: hypothetical protein [Pseudomonas]AYG08997.1 hypothetical protein D7M10_18810 [Pseudomonas fluorescens]MBJ2240554.1 hypothetical protein [Pseudomonas sp. MF6768]MBJ2251758.1 hypothetical protein [Pseudomonas sp. MF6784]MBJ2262181.1 hypothetical protein [Pseudomonas sp. MF6787]MBJ2270061.1 hypothetical protein [Pseudomonas sp. MF6772]NMX32486.1 hypothetical protein [Pseudomonas sp. WS 5413]NMY23147.1 hypothetical protein [Pseudomonas sp. WS 5410]NMY84493.1 hypothetical prote
MRTLLLAALLLTPTLALAETIAWPDLPETCFVSGRSATNDDVDNGCAAFLINVKGKAAGTPIKLEIPQYAMHVEAGTGKETPVIIIQAEENGEIKAVGYKELGTEQLGAALLKEVRLLGTKKPT